MLLASLVACTFWFAYGTRAQVSLAADVSGTATPTSTGILTPNPLPTPTPTETPTPQLSPKALLNRASAALLRSNTFHEVLHLHLELFSLIQVTVKGVGDAVLKRHSYALHVTGQLYAAGQSKKVDEHDIAIGNKYWTKSPGTHNRWKIGSNSSIGKIATTRANPLQVSGTGAVVTDLQNMGSQSVSGIPVWHIRGTILEKVTGSQTAKGTVDYLIGQHNYLPYMVKELVNDRKDAVVVDERVLLSKFSTALKIRAPKVGSVKP